MALIGEEKAASPPPTRELPPHQRLLIACVARWEDAPGSPAIACALADGAPDWNAFVRCSVRHQVSPLVARALDGFGLDPRIPPEISAIFARMSRGNAHRNEVIFRETARLVRALEGAGIPCMALKGVALALAVYPDPALRNFADVDLLVRAADYEAAGEIADSGGFPREFREREPYSVHHRCVRACPEDILTDSIAPEFDPDLSPDTLARHRHRLVVEVHRALFRDMVGNQKVVEEGPLWESPQSVLLPDGMPLRIPAPEVLLLHLAVHASCHGFNRLHFLADVAAVAAHYEKRLDWEKLAALAAFYDVQEPVFQCLELARRAVGACIPAEALARLQSDSGAKPIALAAVFAANHDRLSETLLRHWLGARGLREKTRVAAYVLAPPPVMMRRIYGARRPARVAALYFYRPFQMIGHLLRALFRMARS